MAVVNKIQKQVDLPVWEWCGFNPIGNSAAGSAMCTVDDGTARYIYYLQTTNFYRYDTWTDTWEQLASPLTTGATSAALKYSAFGGYRGQVLGAGASTITVAGLKGNILLKKTDGSAVKIRIMTGTGAGQERTITSIADATIADHGFASSGSTATVVDATKKWKFNQWQGYQVRITFGTGAGQVRKILYNDQTTLTVQANNYQDICPWSNALFTTAIAANSIYQIESSVITVDTPWTVQPDLTSTFVALTGGLWYVTTAGTPGWSALAWYDIHSDVWYSKTAISQHVIAALGTDWSLERTGEVGGQYYGPVAATNGGSNTVRTFTDTAASGWAVDQWIGYQLRITSGTAVGQRRRIIGNTATKLEVERNFDVTPGATDTYQILGNVDSLYLLGNANASMLRYNIESDRWSQSDAYEHGQARIGSALLKTAGSTVPSQEAFGITSIVYAALGITSISGMVANGSGYVAGDIGTICTIAGTTGGKCMITGVSGGGVTSVILIASGSAVTAGTQVITGGTGTLASVTLVAGKTGLVTTGIQHNMELGETVTIAGALTDTTWNASFTVIGVDSLTTFSIANASGTASPTFGALSTTVLFDASKNWNVNEHTGRLLTVYDTNGPAPANTYIQRIISNTANSITVGAALGAIPTNGVSRYSISDIQPFGCDVLYKAPGLGREGYATSGSTTTLVDTSKSWLPNQWAGYRLRILGGTGIGNAMSGGLEVTVTSNTTTTLTFPAWTQATGATPDTTTRYQLMDTFGVANGTFATTTLGDTTKVWVASQWIGKRLRFTAGTANKGNEVAITASTANSLTFGAVTLTDASQCYAILSPPARGSNCNLQWMFNATKFQKGRYMIAPRGGVAGANFFDIYDIARGTWDVNYLFTPQTELAVLGSMYAYDGGDHLYWTVGATGRVLVVDLSTGMVQGSSLTPYAHGVGLAGNRMEIVQTADGLQYLYVHRHTGSEMWRTLAFWAGW